MQHLLKFSFLLIIPLLLTSCFEIREEVNMDEDGTGDLKLVVNMSQSKDQVKKYLDVQESGQGTLPKDQNVESILKHVKTVLRGVDGLSDVEIESDYNNFIFTVNTRFDNVEAINKAVSTVSKQLDYLYVPSLTAKSFESEGNQFRRFFDYPIDPADWKAMPGFAKMALESAKVVSIYRFSRPISEFSNDRARLSPSGKAIMLENSIPGLATGTQSMQNDITF